MLDFEKASTAEQINNPSDIFLNGFIMNSKKTQSVKLMNVSFANTAFNNILDEMDQFINSGNRKGYISITNTESLYHAIKIPEHAAYVNGAAYSCCDGIGVVIAGRLIGLDIPRLHGPDLMLKCCEYGVSRQWRHFFYGGKEGVPNLLGDKLIEKYPGLIVAGVYSPPFRELNENEKKEIISLINECNPDIVWVGLGLLKQEKWIAEYKENLNVPWMIGVGAAFDFYAGTVKRAPEFYRKIGLEWLYRVVFEPRMLRRNFLSLKLILKVIWHGIKTRKINIISKRK